LVFPPAPPPLSLLGKDGASGLEGAESSFNETTESERLVRVDLDEEEWVEKESQPAEAIIQTLVLPMPRIRRSSEIDLRDWRSDVIWPEDDGGAVWSRTSAKERVVGYARAEVASVRRRERAESSMCSDVLGY